MENELQNLRDDVFSSFHQLGKNHPQLEDAQMLVGGSEAAASLKRKMVRISVDDDWITVVEQTMPCLDVVVRQPFRAIEDLEDIVPVELSKRVSEKSVRHLSMHTNLIRKVEGDEITPSKILNVYHEETLVTYENKFTNTLVHRLFNFVDRRYRILQEHFATEQQYILQYATSFSHNEEEIGTSKVNFEIKIDMDSPVTQGLSPQDLENNAVFMRQMRRIGKIYHTLLGYINSDFCKKLGKNMIRPPVVRTNAILKNKNLKACLDLWEYIQSFDKTGYTMAEDEFREVPSEDYVRDFYQTVALQYVQFYNGVMQSAASNRLLSEKHLSDIAPDFEADRFEQEEENYSVYDSQYRKMVPVSRLIENHKHLSRDEQKIRDAIELALKADFAIEQARLEAEAEARRQQEEEAARRLAEEQEQERLRRAEEQQQIAERMDQVRRIKAEQERLQAEAAERARLRAEEEARVKAAEAERLRLEAEEAQRIRLAREEEARRAEEEARRIRMEQEAQARRIAEEQERRLIAEKEEAQRIRLAQQAEQDRIRREEEAHLRELIRQAEELYYHTRDEYLSLPRKKKKKILTDLRAIHEYEQALRQEKLHPTGRPIEKPSVRNWDEVRRWERSVQPRKRD